MAEDRDDPLSKRWQQEDRIFEFLIEKDFLASDEKNLLASFVRRKMSQAEFREIFESGLNVSIKVTESVLKEIPPEVANKLFHGLNRRVYRNSRPEAPPTFDQAEPPTSAMLILDLALPRRKREYVLGDLEEDFRANWLPKYGPKTARRLYWMHAARSVLSIALGRLRVWFGIAFFAKAADWIAQRFGL